LLLQYYHTFKISKIIPMGMKSHVCCLCGAVLFVLSTLAYAEQPTVHVVFGNHRA
jgi:hypothetical protein